MPFAGMTTKSSAATRLNLLNTCTPPRLSRCVRAHFHGSIGAAAWQDERKPLEQVQRLPTYLHIASRLSGAGEGTLLTPTDGSPFSSERCVSNGFVIESRRDWYGVALQFLEVKAS